MAENERIDEDDVNSIGWNDGATSFESHLLQSLSFNNRLLLEIRDLLERMDTREEARDEAKR